MSCETLIPNASAILVITTSVGLISPRSIFESADRLTSERYASSSSVRSRSFLSALSLTASRATASSTLVEIPLV
jgi:hypothetical protein